MARMPKLFSLSALFLSLLPFASSSPVHGTTVNLGYASYEGVYNASGNSTYFLGVRYAAPPVGKLRFQAPRLPEKMNGIQQANNEPPSCSQSNLGAALTDTFTKRQATGPQVPPNANVSQSEDCLFVSVWTPGKPNPKANLPVIVWIHGGGYAEGSIALYNGWEIVKNGQFDVVVVEVQYRLGIFGFLAGQEMKDKGALNAGLLDQDLALVWVQKYISSFGGDPSRVTIWGESAGGGSVLQHLVAHGGRDPRKLFRAAITSSVVLPFQYPFNHRIPEEFYAAVVKLAGCGNAKDSFGCFQTVDSQTLEVANFNSSLQSFFGTVNAAPVVDGEFIIERPVETLDKGHVNAPILLSFNNANEGSIFAEAAASANGTLIEYVQNFAPTLNSQQMQKVVAAYSNVSGLDTTLQQAQAIVGECNFICPSYYMFTAFPGKAYRGWFAIPPATHGEDLSYYFQDGNPFHGPPRAYSNPQFLASFSQAFTDFAKTLNVNIHHDSDNITPNWNFWSDGHTEMLFNATNLTTSGLPVIQPVQTDPGLLSRCSLWHEFAPILQY